jgi:hypothetical protein
MVDFAMDLAVDFAKITTHNNKYVSSRVSSRVVTRDVITGKPLALLVHVWIYPCVVVIRTGVNLEYIFATKLHGFCRLTSRGMQDTGFNPAPLTW